MKTIFAKEKSEYLHCLMDCINSDIDDITRLAKIKRMVELENLVYSKGDELTIIVTTKSTTGIGETALPMTMKDIKDDTK